MPQKILRVKIELRNPPQLKIWVILKDVTHLSLKTCFNGTRYFDSGCSCGITRAKSNLINIETIEYQFVTSGDGSKARVVSKGTLNLEGFPKLESALWLKD